MEGVDVPPYFLCPISLDIMKDPVIVSTGITYDRSAIEKWLFTEKNASCPVTRLPISNADSDSITPNVTLRRLIQSWCSLHSSHGVERFPTPRPPASKSMIADLLNDAMSSQQSQLNCLRKLRSIASESESNKRCLEAAGGVEFLVFVIINADKEKESGSSDAEEEEKGFEIGKLIDDALSLLCSLQLSETALKSMFAANGDFVGTLEGIVRSGSYGSRAYAVTLMKSMFQVGDPIQMMNLSTAFFTGLIQFLNDRISTKATKSTLQLLIESCPFGRNRIKAVEAGGVQAVIDLLLESKERRPCEMMMTVLEQLCQCAEGREELVKHGAGIAVLSKKILRVSRVVSERGVRVLQLVAKHSANKGVMQEMMQLGVVAKLCLVMQVDFGGKTTERAREILRMHAEVWRNSPCLPMNLRAYYPS